MKYLQLNSDEEFQHVYQPIYNLSNFSVHGHEAFIRYKNYHQNIEAIFLQAKKLNKLYDLDTNSISKAMLTYSQQGYLRPMLFLNVFVSTLLDHSFLLFFEDLLSKVDIPLKKIVLEINEAEEITDHKLLRKKVIYLQDKGIKIAIDDFGKGSASLKNVIELEPDYVKLDRYFSTDLAFSSKKQKVVKSLVNHFQGDIKLILEGIEKSEDLAMAKALGVPTGQGYLLGKPDYYIRK